MAGMAIMSDDTIRLFEVIEAAVNSGGLSRLVLSQPAKRIEGVASRIDIRPVSVQNRTMFQWTRQIGNQAFHENHDSQTTLQKLRDSVGTNFRHVHLQSAGGGWSARFSRRGKCRLTAEPGSSSAKASPVSTEHNRRRQYLIPEGSPVPFLVETGIMTADGRVRSRHFHKFRQINRYVEFIADVVNRLPQNDIVHVVDFGCGKSYLTFATHHYLTKVAGRRVSITGLDRRSDVVRTCRDITSRLELRGLQFEQRDIADFTPGHHVHLAVSLHACDTATDDALAQALQWNTDVILAVPCCQHELNAAMEAGQVPLLSQYGILQERFCAMATDAIRAALLDQLGYQTQILEFIDLEHTPKNLLIRAVKRSHSGRDANSGETHPQLDRFCDVFRIPELHLQRRLQESGFLRSHHDSIPE